MEKNAPISNVQSFVMNQNIFALGTKIVSDVRNRIFVYRKIYPLPTNIVLEFVHKNVTMMKSSVVDKEIAKQAALVLIRVFQKEKMLMGTTARPIQLPMNVL